MKHRGLTWSSESEAIAAMHYVHSTGWITTARCRALVAGLAVLGAALHAGDSPSHPLLTVDRIFDSDEFDEARPGAMVWKHRGAGYYTLKKPASGSGRDMVAWGTTGDQPEVIVPAHAFTPVGETQPLSVDSFEFSEDESKLLIFTNTRRVWRQNTRGDYWLLDVTSRELRKLGGDAPPSSLMFACFSPDGSRVAYVRENNLYVQDTGNLEVTALTTNGSPTLINGTFDWVYEEELGLRQGFRWSPDGRSIAYWQLDSSGVREFPLVNPTAGLYPATVSIPYPKTGQQNSAARIGVVSAKGGPTRWLGLPGDPRNHYIASMDWASNSTEIIVQQFNRPQNTNWVLIAQAAGGDARIALLETDAAWLESENPTRWIDSGRSFLWLSERSGWRHAYRASRDGGSPAPITRGDFDVMAIEAVDEAQGWLYYAASPDNPTQRYLYRVRLAGGPPERVTPADQPGTHRYHVSPDARWAIHTYSTLTRPPTTELVSLPDHAVVRVIEDNKALLDKLDKLEKPQAEFFRIGIEGDVLLDGWSLKPPGFQPEAKYPLVFHVYGETAGQTVLDAWAGKTRLWHWLLAQQGYVVLSIDNRGTPAPRGRAWRKIVHRQIGILASADQAAAVRAILDQSPWADASRIGIWGWSGGGSMTLNALFRYPDLYHVGIAIAAVPNQRLYDTIYQERYMGLPEDNPEGYRRGSPITYASQLKGELLLVHGTGDDNVHYQGTEALVHELVTYNKPFTLMAYPNRSHAISEGPNTRRHLYTLMTRFLKEHLPLNPPPAPLASTP